jgi:hypothetical protein
MKILRICHKKFCEYPSRRQYFLGKKLLEIIRKLIKTLTNEKEAFSRLSLPLYFRDLQGRPSMTSRSVLLGEGKRIL